MAVVSSGTAVLGLGDIGALAAKPVTEGRALLFKRANIDIFDLELGVRQPEELVGVVTALTPTFSGINLKDITGPDCFLVEEGFRGALSILSFILSS